MNMEITKLDVRISLDPKDFKGPSLLEWACKRPLKNENFLSLIQSDIEDCERESSVMSLILRGRRSALHIHGWIAMEIRCL